MQISKIRKNKNYGAGFTLVELIIVIAGIAALGSFSFPALLNSIKLNKIEEAKAIMNSYAAECLSKVRYRISDSDYIDNAQPETDDIKLNTLGYMIDPEKNKCYELGIKPVNDEENGLYSFGFSVNTEGKVIKKATPSDNVRFRSSCNSWAGKNCGPSAEQLAKWAEEEAAAQAKADCETDWATWQAEKEDGKTFVWDKNAEPPDCSKVQYTLEGKKVIPNTEEGFQQAKKDRLGKLCAAWITKTLTDNGIKYIGPEEGETKPDLCGEQRIWFHTGDVFYKPELWVEKNQALKEKACIDDLSLAYSRAKKGTKYIPKPNNYLNPDPCQKPHWLCPKDGIYDDYNEYKEQSPCGKVPIKEPPPEKIVPPRCKNFKPDRRCGSTIKKSSPRCRCK